MIDNPISFAFRQIAKLGAETLDTPFKPSVTKSEKYNAGDKNAK